MWCAALFYLCWDLPSPAGRNLPCLLVSSIFHCCFFPNSLLAGFVFSISMATNPVCRKSHLAFIEGTCNYFQSQVLSRSLTFSVP